MSTHLTYLLVDVLCFLFPFLFSFHPAFRFYKLWRGYIPALLLPALFFILWDILFTHLGVWEFNATYTLSPRLINLPLEEVLFFVCIPYACLFTYYCVKRYLKTTINPTLLMFVVAALIAFFLLAAVINMFKLYTSVTFILLALTLSLCLVKKINYLGTFFAAFVLILPFFFLSNGILTGSFIAEPVVMYNPSHNLGIRMFTIPFEDLFYGMLLLLLNVIVFEYFTIRTTRLSRPVKQLRLKRY